MKKTLISTIAIWSVVGASFAAPSPEDRKALCQKHPEKYVWVEKTQACIPINPCSANSSDIKSTYCVEEGHIMMGEGYIDEAKVRTILDRYAQKVLKTKISDVKFLDRSGGGKDSMEFASVAVKTSDGGYFATQVSSFGFDVSAPDYALECAIFAYGRLNTVLPRDGYETLLKINESECRDIADFAALLSGEILQYNYNKDEKICIFKDNYQPDGNSWKKTTD